jgi:hypothetical protein
MNDCNKNKNKLLGEPYGTASNKLKKKILFSLLVKDKLNICFQCGEIIEKIEDLSIEHKSPWMSAENPKEAFYDLDNISFSHLKCNMRAANKSVFHLNARGENGYNNKLTWTQVNDVREKLINGFSAEKLAKEYNVSKSNIFKIKENIRWKTD